MGTKGPPKPRPKCPERHQPKNEERIAIIDGVSVDIKSSYFKNSAEIYEVHLYHMQHGVLLADLLGCTIEKRTLDVDVDGDVGCFSICNARALGEYFIIWFQIKGLFAE